MARIISYPRKFTNTNGNNAPYREMEEIENLSNDYDTYGHWGNIVPGNNYQYAIASRNGAKKKPSKIEVSNFNISDIPDNAKITGLIVEYAYAKKAYANQGHGSFAQPIISIPKFNLNNAGNAPPKNTITAYSTGWFNLNLKKTDLSNVSISFYMGENTGDYPAYILMKYLRLNIEYTIPNYIPRVSFDRNPIQYGDEAIVTVSVSETNNAVSAANVPVTVIVTPGLKIVDGSIECNGTFNIEKKEWNAKLANGKAKLTFRVTPSDASISGHNNVNAYIFINNNDIRSSVESIYIIPQKAYLLECSVSENAIPQSKKNNHYTLFTLTVQNNARTPLTLHLDFDNLKYLGTLKGYDSENKTLTITEWDNNNYFDVQLQLYSTILEDSQIICYSDAWTGVTRINLQVNEEFDYEEYYSELNAPLFTLENMKYTNGEKYVFGCLARINGTERIIKGMKNVRASVINAGEKFTNKISQIGDWELLLVEFTYNENKPLSFRFYGNYIEETEGKIDFGNLFVIHSDYYHGYEYPALSFDDLSCLITDNEYTNLLLEPPEENISSRHYFDCIDWMGLDESEYLVVHGLEITGEISSEEKINLLLGFGHTGIEELDYYTTSINIDNDTQSFKLGGKFETLGLGFNEIQSVLKNIQFYLQVDDIFDNVTPVNVQMKNVRIKLYYSMDSACWEFFINGVSSKHFLLDLYADSEIPRGANYDVNKFKVAGADGEYPNRVNIEENKIKLKFTTCECGTIEDLTILLEKVVEWLYPERDNLDNPILKTISFFYAPDTGYDYYIEDTMDAEAVDGGYDCEVELTVPSGLARSLHLRDGASMGTLGHIGKVKPTIYFNILSHDGEIILVESKTGQKLTLTGEFIDNLALNTSLKLDCKEKKLYYEAYGEWFKIDPNCITMDSDFFTINGRYDFTASVNCRVNEVKYYELTG